MKQLEDAFKQIKISPPKYHNQINKTKNKNSTSRWTLDPDVIDDSPKLLKQRFTDIIRKTLQQKFENEKYLEEVSYPNQETFEELIKELTNHFCHIENEVQRLQSIEEIIQTLGDTFLGELKNYIKHIQSLLDAKIRKFKKKEKRTELVQFDRLVTKDKMMKKKNQACFINEDQKDIKYKMKNETFKNDHSSKKSFGTMNSGSNQNESGGSGKNSGSGSKSGEGNALAVLLANISKPEQKRDKAKQKQQQKYDFSSVLSASVTVRQRNNSSKISMQSKHTNPINSSRVNDNNPIELDCEQDKDQAFIFHRPKPNKRNKL